MAQVEEARKLVAKAAKKLKGGWFSSPSPDEARTCYEDAIKLLRRAAGPGRAPNPEVQAFTIQVLNDCAKVNYELSSFLGAAKNLEEASRVAQKMGDTGKAVDAFVEASLMWRENGQYEQAVQAQMKAAKLVQSSDQDKALALMHRALEVIEEEDRGVFSREVYDECITYAVRQGRLKAGLEFLDRQSSQFEKNRKIFQKKLHSNRLARIIVCLAEGGEEGRQRGIESMNSACAVGDGFMGWDGFSLADSLIEAFKKGGAGGADLAAIVASGDVGIFTKGAFAWLAKQLSTEGLPAMRTGPRSLQDLNQPDAVASGLDDLDVGDGDEPDFS